MFQEEGNDFILPSCKLWKEATISFTFTEAEPRDLLSEGVIGDIGEDDSIGGEDSIASLRGEPSYESVEFTLRGLC